MIKKWHRNKNILALATLVAGIALFPLPPAQARDQNQKGVTTYLKQNIDGYTQVILEKDGKKTPITDEQFPHTQPVTNSHVITWSSQIGAYWQVFYHDIAADRTIQLTTHENNVNPRIHGNYIIWEGQRNGVWQVFLFDGIRIKPLTSGAYPAQDASTDGKYVVFSRKDKADNWQIYCYDIAKGKTTRLTPNSSGRKPIIQAGQVTWQATGRDKRHVVLFRYNPKTKETFYEGPANGQADVNSASGTGSEGSVPKTSGTKQLDMSKVWPLKSTTTVTVEDIKEEIAAIELVNESTDSGGEDTYEDTHEVTDTESGTPEIPEEEDDQSTESGEQADDSTDQNDELDEETQETTSSGAETTQESTASEGQ